MSRSHSQGAQNARFHVLMPRLARDFAYDLSSQGKAQIRILPLCFYRKYQVLLRNAPDHCLTSGELQVSPVQAQSFARKARSVGQQVTDRNGWSIELCSTDLEPVQVPCHWIVQAELASVSQLQDSGGSEQLGDRSDTVKGGGPC